jgi:hypothetical protein
MRLNANYQLPPARPVWVQVPGETVRTLATCPPQATDQEHLRVYFPQCPLVPEKFPDLQPTEVPSGWLQVPVTQSPGRPDVQVLPEVRAQFAAFLDQTSNLYTALRSTDWEACGPATADYNCISNTLGVTTQLPGFGFQDFSFDVRDYASLYLRNGFLPLGGLESQPEEGVEKVILFGMSPSDPGYWDTLRGAQAAGLPIRDRLVLVTHGARQQEDGLFSSKFGDQALIATARAEDVAGVGYGQPIAVFARHRVEKPTDGELD